MLKQKSHFHPSIVTKKQKKRSTSSSYNKQNLSLSHNDSHFLQSQKHNLLNNGKNHKNNSLASKNNLLANKQKQNKKVPKKTKKIVNQENGKPLLFKDNFLSSKQDHPINMNNQLAHLPAKNNTNKKNKIPQQISINNRKSLRQNYSVLSQHKQQSFINYSSVGNEKQINQHHTANKHKNKPNMVIIQSQNNLVSNESRSKNILSHRFDEFQQVIRNQKQSNFHSLLNCNRPDIVSRSSTILSSTGNIQFSEYSNDDIQEYFNNSKNGKETQNNVKNNKNQVKYNFSKIKLNPTKAATLIQKTWRGYLTRKLLEQYIQSFQPMYEEQLKQIRSNHQSRRQSRPITSTHKNLGEKSSFFDQKSELSECSQIKPIETQLVNIVTSYPNISTQQFNESSQRISSKQLNQTNRSSSKRFDLPMQVNYFKKHQKPTNIKKKQPQIQQQTQPTSKRSKISQNRINMINKKNILKNQQKTDAIVQSTLKSKDALNYRNEARFNEDNQNIINKKNNQQTKKITKQFIITQTKKLKNLNMCRQIYSVKVQNHSHVCCLTDLNSHIQNLHKISNSLQQSFINFNNLCVNQLKAMVKKNKLNLQQLMERKQSIKDIMQNGKQFILNVEQQISKALTQMQRITTNGPATETQRQGQYESAQKSPISNQFEKNTHHQMKQNKQMSKQESNLLQKHKEYDSKIENKKYFNCEPSFDDSSQFSSQQKRYYNSHSSSKNNSNRKYHSRKSHASQFYKIQLPTQEYSIKGKSPIQEDMDEQHSYNDQTDRQQYEYEAEQINDDDNLQHSKRSQDQLDQNQSPILKTNLALSKQYQTHRQSYQILNQFLLNLIQEFTQINSCQQTSISQIQYLCQTLKRITSDSQNKTIIDRCLIQFMVQMMTQTFTLTEIYEGFRRLIQQLNEENEYEEQEQVQKQDERDNQIDQNQLKLKKILKRWIQQLQKWEMNIIQQVPSKMESSSFINTLENISFHQIRDSINNNLNSIV